MVNDHLILARLRTYLFARVQRADESEARLKSSLVLGTLLLLLLDLSLLLESKLFLSELLGEA
jgi:hypothetical protein